MAYKVRFRPIEVLGPAGWRLMTGDEPMPMAPLPNPLQALS
jgi:arginyl-tRNA--protein-N-Asp/Glu arginylyltransferase